MQKVSDKWIANQKGILVGESQIELSMKVTDPDASEDVSASVNSEQSFSQIEDVVGGVDYTIAPHTTLELNFWLLDGSRTIMSSDDDGTNRFVSYAPSMADKTFENHPIISLGFTEVHENLVKGVTVVWGKYWNEYAEEFIVTAYNGEDIVATERITENTSVTSVVYMDIIGYDRITIEVVKWCLPYHRARIEEIIIGITQVFTKSDLMSYSHNQSVNPLSTELPNISIDFSVSNINNDYNPHNPDGMSQYLMERQEVSVRYGYKIDGSYEWIDGGKVYLSEWDAPQDGNTADFKARDLLAFMTDTYYGGMYRPEGVSLYDLALEVLTDANLPTHTDGSVRWEIDESLKDIYTVAPLPIDTHANCLQLIANAGGCAIHPDRSGKIKMKAIPLKPFDMVDFPEYKSVRWADGVPSVMTRKLACLQPGTYEMTISGTLTQKNSNFAQGDQCGVVLTYKDGHNEDLRSIPWYTTDSVGTTKVGSRRFTITHSEYETGFDKIYIYGCGRTGVGATGLADINSITIKLISTDYAIDYNNSYSKSTISLSPPLKNVSSGWYQYAVKTEKEELYRGKVAVSGTQEVIIPYSGSATSIDADVLNGTMVEATAYTNACKLTVTGDGEVEIVVKGYPITSTKTEITIPNGINGDTMTVDNPLITSIDRATVVGEIVKDYYKHRMSLSSSWRTDPRLDALDYVTNENDYNKPNVLMTDVVFGYNGAFKGSGEGKVI